jgi:cellulose biosynthesis protein BcsQ
VKIVASYNVKGGVGKTTAAVNLAYLSAQRGRRTLLWDLDPQGAATFLFRVKPRVKGGSKKLVGGQRPIDAGLKGTDFEGLDLLPADVTYRKMDLDLASASAKRPESTLSKLLADLADDYDVVILDTPPSLSLVSENVLHAADLVVVPIIPTVLATRTYDQVVDFLDGFDGHRPPLHAFFSMADRRKALHRDIIAELKQKRSGFSSVVVPALAQIERMTTRQAPLPAFSPRSRATQAYKELWDEVAKLVDNSEVRR